MTTGKFCIPLALAILLSCTHGTGELSPGFRKALDGSGLVSRPIPLETERSFEERNLPEGISFSKSLPIDKSLSINYKTLSGKRARGSDSDPDYATYGNHSATIPLEGMDLEGYNILTFQVDVNSPGDLSPSLNLVLSNRDPSPKDGFTPPTGSHLVPLVQGKNKCRFWIGDLRRDCADNLRFYVTNRGWNLEEGVVASYTISDITFGKADISVKVSGWTPEPGKIVISNSGYYSSGAKTAIMDAASAPSSFRVRTKDGKTVFEGDVTKATTTIGEYAILDFSPVHVEKTGEYVLEAGESSSEPFRIGDHPFDELQWRLLNFIFGQRCGFPVEGVHPFCHSDLFAVHEGDTLSYGGGWHDAGDLSQQTLQTGDVAFNLLEAAQAAGKRAPALSRHLEEEALWGLDFMEKVRFPDGSRASSMGLLLWQDGKKGTFDDIFSVRVQGMAYDNFLYAAYQAYAAKVFSRHKSLSAMYTQRAERDFAYALAKFERDGYDKFYQPYEHTYNTPHSLYQATISWAASMLYGLTGNSAYARKAAEAMLYVLSCQMEEGPGKGYFCKDESQKSLSHNVHQSREHIFALALDGLCRTQASHPDFNIWKKAAEEYGAALKRYMYATAPYGMIPSGVYSLDEPDDYEAFARENVFIPGNAADRFRTQVRTGIQLDSTHFLKRFPAWFGVYNGNNAVLLSQGKAAAVCARLLGDRNLEDMAREQIYWVLGKNPFAQSMVYGEGFDYPLMDSFSSGPLTGEVPVGIRTIDDTDIPYWPQVNNACYKEVWTCVAGKILSLISEL